MSRRDTIIIAVLLNAGVLAILFMLAVNEKSDDFVYQHKTPPIVRNEQPVVDTKPFVVSAPVSDDFIDFSIEDTMVSSADDSFIAPSQYLVPREPISPGQPKQPVAATSSKPQVSNDSYVEVTVKRGDSLDKISRNNGTTIEAIKKANNLKSDVLSIGQVLRVPLGNGVKAITIQKAPEQKRQPLSSSDNVYYVLKTGDSPWKIAKLNEMNVDDLLKLNNLDEEKARNLKVGDKIRVR